MNFVQSPFNIFESVDFNLNFFYELLINMKNLVFEYPNLSMGVVVVLFYWSIMGIPMLWPGESLSYSSGGSETFLYTPDSNYNVKVAVEERFCSMHPYYFSIDEMYCSFGYNALTLLNTVPSVNYFTTDGDGIHPFFHRGYHVTLLREPGTTNPMVVSVLINSQNVVYLNEAEFCHWYSTGFLFFFRDMNSIPFEDFSNNNYN